MPARSTISAGFAEPGTALPRLPNLDAIYERYECCNWNGPHRGAGPSAPRKPIAASLFIPTVWQYLGAHSISNDFEHAALDSSGESNRRINDSLLESLEHRHALKNNFRTLWLQSPRRVYKTAVSSAVNRERGRRTTGKTRSRLTISTAMCQLARHRAVLESTQLSKSSKQNLAGMPPRSDSTRKDGTKAVEVVENRGEGC